MTPHQRRLLKTFSSALFVLLLAGVTYQGVATALERRAFRYPGRLVPVGDHQLHVYCVGQGAPTVVLEAPALGFSASWTIVQTGLAMTTRVCAYDRAGLGWSEASDRPFDSGRVQDELHALLMGAGEAAPYLVVGDGLGAAFAAQFAAQFPHDTAALVLLDSPGVAEPSATERVPRSSPSPWLARTGVLRVSRLLSITVPTLPGPAGGAVAAFGMRPDHLTRGAMEIRQLDAIVTRAREASFPADLPVHRLDAPPGTSFLTTPAQAEPVARLVTNAVRDWRRSGVN